MHMRWRIAGYTWMGEYVTSVTVTQDHNGRDHEVLYEKSFQCPDMGETAPLRLLQQVLSALIDDLYEEGPGISQPGPSL